MQNHLGRRHYSPVHSWRPSGTFAAAHHCHGRSSTCRRRSLREQLSRAASVQRSLLPEIPANVGEFELASLYLPCEALGGDFYDLARCDDCALLLMADVMGHGAEAALITMLVKAAFVEASADTSDPATLLAGMGSRLRRLVPERVFVAAAIARLPLQGADVRLANAGLPHPYLLRADACQVEEICLDGRPIGLLGGHGDFAPSELVISLSPGHLLLMASDGIGAVESKEGQIFEGARMRDSLTTLVGQDGHEVIDALLEEASSFGRGRRFADDVNIVTISRRCDQAYEVRPRVLSSATTQVPFPTLRGNNEGFLRKDVRDDELDVGR